MGQAARPAVLPKKATPMSHIHAVVWLDHQHAQVLKFNTDTVQAQTVKAHAHPTRQHGSAVRDGHAFFGAVCAALAGPTELLVTGGHTTQADFKHYLDQHRPALLPLVKGWQTVDHPSENQLLALARQFFLKFDRMAGSPTPS